MTKYFVSTHDVGRTAPICIDIVCSDGKSAINRETLEQVQARYPNTRIMTSDEYRVLHDKAMATEPVKITEEKYIEMLEVLPPMKWRNGGGAQTFMMCEFLSGNITGIYCNIGDRYWSFNGPATLTHDEIVQKCMAA